jgi:hypothetical protein
MYGMKNIVEVSMPLSGLYERSLCWRIPEDRLVGDDEPNLPSCPLHPVPQLGQFSLHCVAVVTLDFDSAVFDGAAGAA